MRQAHTLIKFRTRMARYRGNFKEVKWEKEKKSWIGLVMSVSKLLRKVSQNSAPCRKITPFQQWNGWDTCITRGKPRYYEGTEATSRGQMGVKNVWCVAITEINKRKSMNAYSTKIMRHFSKLRGFIQKWRECWNYKDFGHIIQIESKHAELS